MSAAAAAAKTKKPDLVELLSAKVKGQADAIRQIAPYIQMYEVGLAPEGRPAGVFLLLGPTGTGKTRTVEALAEVLHGSKKNVLKIDCGEFQMDHEVAKLIGAPPGYLGHRETQALLTQQRLSAVTSESCDVALVLFDEIEKAAPSLTRLLLGILDKATLRLGDNSTVNFEKTLIFLTSNLGSQEMMKAITPDFGFQSGMARERTDLNGKLEGIGVAAVRKRFSPEFVNRIDAVITYKPLGAESLDAIVDQHLDELQYQITSRMGERAFEIVVGEEARAFLVEKGTSPHYGARELKRAIHRSLTQPLAAQVANGEITPGSVVFVDVTVDGQSLCLRAETQLKALAA